MTWYYKHHANIIHYFYTSQYSPRFIPHDVWDDGVGCVLLTFFWAEEQHSLAFNTWTSEVDTVPLPGDELSFALGKDTGASLGWDGNFLGAVENVLRHSWLDHSDCGLIIWFDTYWQTFLGRFKGIDCIMQLDVYNWCATCFAWLLWDIPLDWPFRKDGATRRKLADPTCLSVKVFLAAVADE